ncbi:ARM repeat-containing protein, partial [Aureobasidium melanogenum]
MADAEVNGEQTLDAGRLRQVALSSSTKRRSAELLSLHDKIVSKEYPLEQLPNLLNLLFDTYPLYIDTQSRQAVELCLVAIFSTPETEAHVSSFVAAVENETKKPSLAPANAFVLIRWCALFLQQFALQKSLWDTWGLKIVQALVRATNTFESSNPRHSTHQTVLRVTRRGFRKLFSCDFGEDALNQSITALTTKAATPTPQNALVLGVIAGVSARLPKRSATFETRKSDYNAFYLREFIGSRTVLPQFIANSLVDYFNSFVNLEDLKKEIIPAIEKALLRAPEIVLNDLLTPMIEALPSDLDLSEILANNLLKPLVSSAKSSNATIRAGALRTFAATARRSQDDKLIEKVLGEILTPLKTGKVPSADQKIIFAQMLAALNSSEALAASIPQGLAPVAAKEPNEAAASAEIAAISKHLKFGLEKSVAVNAATTDAYAKGVAEKRLPFRKLWTLSIAEIVWSLEGDVLKQPEVATLVDSVIGKMIDSFNEVVANPVSATQNGQVTLACAVTALSLAKVPQLAELKNASVVKKASLLDRAIALEPKPSFLLNTRVYTKLTSHEDLIWLTRALAATSSGIASSSPAIQDAWAQTFIYLIVASGLPATARSETIASLRSAYLAQPEAVGKTIIQALAHWSADVELESKESAALLAKTGRQELHKIIRCICLTKEEVAAGQVTIEQSVLDNQMINLLVLCRPELMPKSSWIEACLRTGTDPGELVKRNTSECMDQIVRVTEDKLLS